MSFNGSNCVVMSFTSTRGSLHKKIENPDRDRQKCIAGRKTIFLWPND